MMMRPTITMKMMMTTTAAPESNGLRKRRDVLVGDVSRDVASLTCLILDRYVHTGESHDI